MSYKQRGSKVDDLVAGVIQRIQEAVVTHKYKKCEKELTKELKEAVEQSGLNEDQILSKYIMPRLRQAEDSWDQAFKDIDDTLSRMRKLKQEHVVTSNH